jgi:SsrA-binding protein
LKKREIDKLIGATQRSGITLVPLSIYFNDRGIAKVQLGLAKGKRKADKREADKERDWKREQARLMCRRNQD